MDRFHTRRGRTAWLPAVLVAALAIAGCAGIAPYEPRNQREEGPEKGLFTGAEAQFVIVRKTAESAEGGVDKSYQEDPEDEGQSKLAGD